MVMIKDNDGVERYYLKQQVYDLLMRVKEKITEEDQECWICFGGDTGCGKSLMSMRWMFPIFRELTINEVCFDKKEFINCVLQAKKGTGIICDESISILFSRGSMTKEGRLIAELIAQIRQKNLAVFLNIPQVISLDWTAQHKLNAYVHVWESRRVTNGNIRTLKGNAAVYPEMSNKPYRTKIIDYMRRKKANPMMVKKRPSPLCTVEGDMIGGNCKKPWYPVEESKYREKKESVLKKYDPDKPKLTPLQERQMKQRDKAIILLREQLGMSFGEIAKALDMSKSGVHDLFLRNKGGVEV